MQQFKRAQVVMLPHLDGIIYDGNDWQNIDLVSNFSKSHYNSINGSQYSNHLYIISDDEIKEGDWIYHLDVCDITKAEYDGNILSKLFKKIIATTDTSLKISKFSHFSQDLMKVSVYKDYLLPQPSQQFIERYVEAYNKGEVITDILVEYETLKTTVNNKHFGEGHIYAITNNIKVNSKDNTITIKKLKDSWNKEELEEIVRKAFKAGVNKGISLEIYKTELDNNPKADENFDKVPTENKWIEENL